MLFSFLIFTISALIGVFSTKLNPEFSKQILGDEYVKSTLQNIAKNDPMAVYKNQNEINMFLGITINNILVAFRTFVMGAFFLVGTIFILLYNGVMVGTFQYFFVEHNLFLESSLTIWMHGTIEILSIIVAGGAGMVLGRGFIFPGTLSRWQSFQVSAKKGIKIMIGLVPLFVIAGFIEGFITRHTDLPDGVRLGFILLSLTFMLFYFVLLPYKNRNNILKYDGIERFEEKEYVEFSKYSILTFGEIFTNTFKILSVNGSKIFTLLLIFGALTSTLFVTFFSMNPDELINKASYFNSSIYTDDFLMGKEVSFMFRLVIITVFSVFLSWSSAFIKQAFGIKNAKPAKEVSSIIFVRFFLIFTALFCSFYIGNGFISFLFYGDDNIDISLFY